LFIKEVWKLEITEQVIPHIEKAVGLKLYEHQKNYLISNNHMGIGRGTGKTVAYIIKLALSEGEALNMRRPHEFSDYGDGSRQYASYFFRREFMKYWEMLKDYGFSVREVKHWWTVKEES
jgi:hypothetical protein